MFGNLWNVFNKSSWPNILKGCQAFILSTFDVRHLTLSAAFWKCLGLTNLLGLTSWKDVKPFFCYDVVDPWLTNLWQIFYLLPMTNLRFVLDLLVIDRSKSSICYRFVNQIDKSKICYRFLYIVLGGIFGMLDIHHWQILTNKGPRQILCVTPLDWQKGPRRFVNRRDIRGVSIKSWQIEENL